MIRMALLKYAWTQGSQPSRLPKTILGVSVSTSANARLMTMWSDSSRESWSESMTLEPMSKTFELTFLSSFLAWESCVVPGFVLHFSNEELDVKFIKDVRPEPSTLRTLWRSCLDDIYYLILNRRKIFRVYKQNQIIISRYKTYNTYFLKTIEEKSKIYIFARPWSCKIIFRIAKKYKIL
jgi:hypothetical protein